MFIYSKTFENVETKGSENYPVEDQFYVGEDTAIIADGVTRDPIGVGDESKFTAQELLDKYPRPSVSEIGAKEVCNTFKNSKGMLKDKLIECNKALGELNKKYIKECDYLENDMIASVASCVSINGNKLEYAYICDCGVVVYDKNGNIKFQTEDCKEKYSDPYIKKIGIPWYLPEERIIVRRYFRNKLDNIVDGKCVSYGAFTGEKEAIEFIKSGEVILDKGDVVVLYSDGFVKYTGDNEFINQTIHFDKERFEEYIEKKSTSDPDKFGREKTIIIYDN